MRVGRDQHLRAVRESVRGAAEGGGACLIVEGEPGSGRTSLASELVAEAGRLGCAVRSGAAAGPPDGPPLQAALDCLYPDGSDRSAADARAAAGLLLRDTVPRWAALPAALDALVADVERWCAEGPLVLVLDDLHTADRATLQLWQRLARTAAGSRLPLLLAATRCRVPRRPEADLLCAALGRLGARTLRLEPLDDQETARAVREQLGAPPGPRLREAARLSGGNPRWLRELLRHWSARGVLTVDDLTAELACPVEELPEPPGSVVHRLRGRLGPDPYTTLRHAALLGAEFTARELALVRGTPVGELLAGLEEPFAAELLDGTGEGLRFRHPVVRQALYADVPGALRAALHQDAAGALARAGQPPARVAAQLLGGGALEPWALRWLADHGPAVVAAAPGPGTELLERAIAQTRTSGPADREGHAAERAGVRAGAGWPDPAAPAGAADATDPADPADPLVLEEHLADAALLLRRPGAVERLALLRDRARHPDRRAGLAVRLVAALTDGGDPAAALVVAEGALDEDFPCAATRLRLEARVAEFRFHLGHWDAALTACARAEPLWPADPWLPVTLHGLRALLLGHRDERAAAEAELARAEAAWARAEAAWARAEAAWARAEAAWARMEAERARSGTDRAPEGDRWPRESGSGRTWPAYTLLARSLLAERDGLITVALDALRPALSEPCGGSGGAEEEAGAFGDERPWVLSEIVRLALEAGEPHTARAAVAACVGIARDCPDRPGTAMALLRGRGLFGQDPRLLAQAAAHGADEARPLRRGQILEDLAVAQAWHGDLAGARASLARAAAAYEEPGAHWDLVRAEARLRRLGVRRSSRGARRRPASGWDALTPAELKVALLVAEGRSNPEIASALFLSRRTVQTHVSHILGKLQVRSRALVAAQAAGRAQAGTGPADRNGVTGPVGP
ncbi:ATP-binding protein [Streptomyces sp. NPDC048603]|uniref:ATP-binding protein n=1 Tax=Streptomyces sp. NPDC048603 TaxID=3365577 RepID=UPI003717C91F